MSGCYNNCPRKQKWPLHYSVNKDTKSMVSTLSFPCKSSWDFCRKTECDMILSQWRMLFQVSDSKGKNFLDLLNDNLNPLESLSIKEGPWLQWFTHSNSLCARSSRAITNHAPIEEYWLRFFPKEEFTCLCGNYPIETRINVKGLITIGIQEGIW